MTLAKEYASISADAKDKIGKKIISDDAFAVCDFIERLINKLEHARESMVLNG
jgi:hypothetical protein